MKHYFSFFRDSQYENEFKAGDVGYFLCATYQDIGPVCWIVTEKGVYGTCPSNLRPVEEVSEAAGSKTGEIE
jgi:hypothetical protein